MKSKKHCLKCGHLAVLNEHGICKECQDYDLNKNNSKN